MPITKSKIQYLPTTILIVVVLLVWVLSFSGMATAGTYADSAHGNATYGVNRSDVVPDPDHPDAYDIGACAHCHDTFDSSTCGVNNFMLFYDDAKAQCDLFCFTCHSGSEAWQPTVNYLYSVNFGGYSPPGPYQDIGAQFCDGKSTPAQCGSRHHLIQIHDFLTSPTVAHWGFNSDPDPCVACHNPHADQRNHPVAIDGEGKLNTAIRRPKHYKSTNPQYFLWGDDDGVVDDEGKPERMDEYAASVGGTYQAPYYGIDGPWDPDDGPFEPAGDGTSDGSNLPNYVTFCLDCHQYELYDPERGEPVKAIDYANERHGGYPSNTCAGGLPGSSYGEGTLKPPYDTYEPNESNYVLSCLDCHEPHGTPNRMFLLRRVINGQALPADIGTCGTDGDANCICIKCHEWPHSDSNECADAAGVCTAGPCHGFYPDDRLGALQEMHGSIYDGGGADCVNQPAF